MSAFKDLFSGHAQDYARYRPTYPRELFARVAALASRREVAVDIGAGNGQASQALLADFARVVAVEPSAAQLNAIAPDPRIEPRQTTADATGLPDASADAVVCAQAFHWFAGERFFDEVRRIARPGAVLVVWCYSLARITPDVDAVVSELYRALDADWEPERRLVESGYQTVVVPFPELPTEPVAMSASWTLEQLVGYLRTWSALKHYIARTGQDPLLLRLAALSTAWGLHAEREITWPLAVRAFRVAPPV